MSASNDSLVAEMVSLARTALWGWVLLKTVLLHVSISVTRPVAVCSMLQTTCTYLLIAITISLPITLATGACTCVFRA
jgi:hypothetical protein